jgi:hypothetical protein
MKMNEVLQVLILLVVVALTVSLLSGCAGRTTTTESSSEVRRDSDYPNYPYPDGTETVEVTKSEAVITEERPRGFFGILGDIIALPFRAVGSIL